ncbi:HEPN domain-containing protein [uncultured Shewanella sp.]|uniref:HEPN domain-containing protein n=1 Tax=uncultured Shewanella sp. TaxID=173975 RepID=UPI002605B50A|nr:HEPN domain-containing protein [uncultured Shewanella sp.]
MIFDRHIGFLDEFSVDVEVFTSFGSVVGNGNLSVKKNSTPQISFDFRIDISKFLNQKSFTCKSEKYTYQLLDCDVLNDVIIPRFLIRGKKTRTKFKKVNLLFQGLSQWMDTDGKFELSDNKIIKTRESKVFNTEIVTGERRFSLSNEHWCEIKSVGANNNQIYEYTLLTVEAKNFSWSSAELLEIISDIRTFFTLLLGHYTGLEYVLDASDNNSIDSIYFLNATRDVSKEILQRECFAQSSQLFYKERWQGILQGYFSSRNDQYRNLWSRISGMLSYEGFWEYRILAYVSLVDRYVSLYAENEEKSLSKKQFKKYRRAARSSLEFIKSECEIKDENERKIFDDVINSMCKQIGENIQNTSIASFNEKFDLALSKTNNNIIEILDFDKNDFNHLKRIRNCVAHGDEPTIENDGDITYEVTITNKLALLLRYWAFVDIGFSFSEFIAYLTNWMYPITRQARISKSALDAASGNYHFIKVNKTNFKRAKQYRNNCLVFDYVKASDTLRVNILATEQARSLRLNPNRKNRTIEEELMTVVDTKKVHNIAYFSNLYIKYESDQLQISAGACIFNCPDHILSCQLIKGRMCKK